MSTPRHATVHRRTGETEITVALTLDGTGESTVETGIGFLDHMIGALARHARWSLTLRCAGDLHVDDHHTAEDTALALGAAFAEAVGPRVGIARFGHAYAPLDEALARAVVDLSGRPWPAVELGLRRPTLGAIATENLTHWVQSFAIAAKANVHLQVLAGQNDHHRAEAAFKALALALRAAAARDAAAGVPSTKGTLDA
jgi:imidazoleglycerol-phosphate dehydratase